jgi:hypothetical protein
VISNPNFKATISKSKIYFIDHTNDHDLQTSFNMEKLLPKHPLHDKVEIKP